MRFLLALSVLLATLSSCYNPFNNEKAAVTRVDSDTLVAQPLVVSERFRSVVEHNHNVYLPPGFKIRVFYAGRLDKARFMAWSPDNVLYVANKSSGEILALPDRNHNGEADTAIVVADDLESPHDLEFYNGALYVAEELRIVRLIDANGDGIFETRSIFIDNIAQGAQLGGGGHDTRTIVFDAKNRKMYLSIGSSCNVCREDHRAIIEEYNDQGAERRVYARGVRNAVGMTLHPVTGKLWATNNGSDWQGDDIPPEWVDEVRDGGFYGHPFAWGDGRYYDFNVPVGGYRDLLPITRADSALVRSMVPPAALIQAHSAPMAIEFPDPSFQAPYRNGAFVALRGSWNRKEPTGYKVVYLRMRPDIQMQSDNRMQSANRTVESVSDFLRGFTHNGKAWARPVGLETDTRGNLYVSSDAEEQFIAVVTPILH